MSTKIQWADEVWNPLTGCSPISEGCQNCYAKRMANRLKGRFGYPEDEPFRVTHHPDKMKVPYKWKKPKRIFLCSMGDIFHEDIFLHNCFDYGIDTGGNHAVLLEIFETMNELKQHTFIVLTKRPDKAKVFFDSCFGGEGYPPSCRKIPDNMWLGVSVENQQAADERIPILLDIPAAVRFVSVEPMLGAVDLSKWIALGCKDRARGYLCSDMKAGGSGCDRTGRKRCDPYSNIGWIIAGGETGPGARNLNPEWIEDLYHQCRGANIPFFFKQWGRVTEKEVIDHNGYSSQEIDENRYKAIEKCKEFPA